jgi:hypothetical protein
MFRTLINYSSKSFIILIPDQSSCLLQELFLLATDQGFLKEPRVVWETLNTIDGDIQVSVASNFFASSLMGRNKPECLSLDFFTSWFTFVCKTGAYPNGARLNSFGLYCKTFTAVIKYLP